MLGDRKLSGNTPFDKQTDIRVNRAASKLVGGWVLKAIFTCRLDLSSTIKKDLSAWQIHDPYKELHAANMICSSKN